MVSFRLSFAGLFGLGDVTQSLEPGGPVVVEELPKLGHGPRVRPVQPTGAVAPLDHEIGVFENGEVLGDRGPGDVMKLVRDRSGRQLLRPHEPQDRPAAGFGDCSEGCVHMLYCK